MGTFNVGDRVRFNRDYTDHRGPHRARYTGTVREYIPRKSNGHLRGLPAYVRVSWDHGVEFSTLAEHVERIEDVPDQK